MPYEETVTIEKARRINSTPSIYGTFAEIGAGQFVVNHFFRAGQASQTVAKSMSAYDMVFSDEIYGHTGRYVSEERLFKMLDHEYDLLQKRLKKPRGHNTRFFAFANTVTASTVSRIHSSDSHHHGWMGIRFQNTAGSSYNEIILHTKLLDKTRLQQYEILGVLGVNLIYSAFYSKKNPEHIITSLFDNFEANRVDIDVLRCTGKVFEKLHRQQLNKELIRQNLTQAMLFQNKAENILPADALYGKNILIIQHTDHPRKLWECMKTALAYIKKRKKNSSPPVLLIDVPLSYLKNKTIEFFLKKYIPQNIEVDNRYILISHFNNLYELKAFVRTATEKSIFIMLDPDRLNTLFSQSNYQKSTEDILAFFSRLLDKNTTLITHQHQSLSSPAYCHDLEKHLIASKQLVNLG